METVAGFLIARLGALPEVGATIECENHEFKVTELDGRRVARVRVTPITPLHPPPDHAQVTEPGLQE